MVGNEAGVEGSGDLQKVFFTIPPCHTNSQSVFTRALMFTRSPPCRFFFPSTVFDISTILIDSHMFAGYSLFLIRPHTIQMVARTAGKDVGGPHIPVIRPIQPSCAYAYEYLPENPPHRQPCTGASLWPSRRLAQISTPGRHRAVM